MKEKKVYDTKWHNTYNKEHYERLITTFPKGTKERIQATGITLNNFIKSAVLKALEDAER